jgi:dTDP-4-dehydrorhamnose 3,5-epimerase
MEIVETPFQGCFLLKSTPVSDGRGSFFESYNQQKFESLTGWKGRFVQDNQSESAFGVVRGMHFQRGEYAQAKLVRVLKGTVLDVILDLRPESTDFGKVFSIEMSAENNLQLFIPRGFAHGFSVLSPSAIFFYKCDNYYHKVSEGGIFPLDNDLSINWCLQKDEIILSEKDKLAEKWKEYLLQTGKSGR